MIRSVLVGICALLVITSCNKEGDTPNTTPSITFRADSGYVHTDTTAGTSDTLRVGVNVAKGSLDLEAFIVRVTYNGSDVEVTDDVPVSAGSFSFEKTIVTRSVAGTEQWDFGVRQSNGDLVYRAITLTVQ